MRKWTEHKLLPAAVALLVSSATVYAGPAPSPCYRVELKEKPLWISGATWLEDTAELLVVDPAQNKLLAYNPHGEVRTLPCPQIEGVDEQPTAISLVDKSGFLLEVADGTLVRLGKDMSVRGGRTALIQKNQNGYHVGSLYQWKLAGNSIVAYGALLRGDQMERGFFRVPLGSLTRAPEMLTPLPDSDFYLIGNSYIATVGNVAYYLAMGKNPALYKVSPGQKPRKLAVEFPEEIRTRPDFQTHMTGPKSAAKHFAELETFTVASGLYSHGKMLYLLARKPDGAGGTSWFFYKIDLDRKLFSPGIKLPTSANFLTVVPSEKAFYLIERGPVEGIQRQVIASMVAIESAAIASLASLPTTCPAE
jgi:hypothetical protein